jgi:hypothetical protein
MPLAKIYVHEGRYDDKWPRSAGGRMSAPRGARELDPREVSHDRSARTTRPPPARRVRRIMIS